MVILTGNNSMNQKPLTTNKVWKESAMNKPSHAVAVVESPSRDMVEGMSIAGLLRQVELVQEVMKNVMKENTHYGASFPGDTKKNLLKPGAEKLLFVFRLSPSQEVEVIEMPNLHREYRIKTRVAMITTGQVVAEGWGSCCTMETKYRYRSGKRKCPTCGSEAIIKTNKGRNPGGYWCVGDKGGCGGNFDKGDPRIEDQVVGKVENPDIADVFNTVLKMGCKRSLVAATIIATACGDMFTQDIEDIQDNLREAEAARVEATPPAAQTESAQTTAPVAAQPSPVVTAAPVKTGAQRYADAVEDICRTMKMEPGMKLVASLKKKHGVVGDNVSVAQWTALLEDMERIVRTGEASSASDKIPF